MKAANSPMAFTLVPPKQHPMVEIGCGPTLVRIAKSYSAQSANDFAICCGYNWYVIKEYFLRTSSHIYRSAPSRPPTAPRPRSSRRVFRECR